MKNLLTFGKGNAKLGKQIFTFSLPAGHSCPFANECLSKADKITGKITDGKNLQFRCFAASSESIFPNVRASRWNNFDLLRKSKDMAGLILESLPKKASIIRIHVSGDFFSQVYFNAWLKVASIRKDVIFYAYTKSLNYWVARLGANDGDVYGIPDNFRLTASYGGKWDSLIIQHGLKYAKVVYSPQEAKELGLQIDHDDSHAIKSKKPFALLLHGMQPKGSKASEAIKNMNAKGIAYAYQR